MKRILALLLTLILTISLIACNSKDSKKNEEQSSNENKSVMKNEEIVTPVKKTFRVTYDNNDGTFLPTEEYTEGSKIETAQKPSKDGHLFEGWFRDDTCTQAAIFPLTVDSDITLYAKWLTLKNTQTFKSATIKDWNGYNNSAKYYVTPSGFEMDKLDALGYKMTITVSYTVRYEKDYKGIGYTGSPKYEIYLLNSDNAGNYEEDIGTSTTATEKTLSYTQKISNIKNDRLTLTFSTNNIQNKIHFENIKVTFECHK